MLVTAPPPKAKCLNQKLTKSEQDLQSAHREPHNSGKDQKNVQLTRKLPPGQAGRVEPSCLCSVRATGAVTEDSEDTDGLTQLTQATESNSAAAGKKDLEDKPAPKLSTTTEVSLAAAAAWVRGRQQGPSRAPLHDCHRSKAIGEEDGLLSDGTVGTITI